LDPAKEMAWEILRETLMAVERETRLGKSTGMQMGIVLAEPKTHVNVKYTPRHGYIRLPLTKAVTASRPLVMGVIHFDQNQFCKCISR